MQYRTVQKEIECCCGCGDCSRMGEQIGADEIGNVGINLRTINGRRRFVSYVQPKPKPEPESLQKTKHVQIPDSDEKLQQSEREFFQRILDAMTWG
mgnify:CR=1 FL=1